MNIFCQLARQSIKYYLETGKQLRTPKNLPPTLKTKSAVFVSIHTKSGNLRGCIGTFIPTQPNLAQEIIYNAISATSEDPRFYPIKKSELKDLKISVDLLSDPETAKDVKDLNPKKYGVIVKSASGQTGLLLPDLPEIDSAEKQIAIACQKAAISPTEPIQLYRFTVKRHHE